MPIHNGADPTCLTLAGLGLIDHMGTCELPPANGGMAVHQAAVIRNPGRAAIDHAGIPWLESCLPEGKIDGDYVGYFLAQLGTPAGVVVLHYRLHEPGVTGPRLSERRPSCENKYEG